MKYSVILLSYDPEEKLTEMIAECKRRLIQNSQGYDYELIKATEKGAGYAVNKAFAQASGDYLVIFCNDMMLDDPEWLSHLAVPGVLTGWREVVFGEFYGGAQIELSCVCIPREIWQDVGEFDETYDGGMGFQDNDWIRRLKQKGYSQRVVPVKIQHLEAKTFNTYFDQPTRRAMSERNRLLFSEKWKELST